MTDPMTDPRERTIYRAAELMRRGDLTAETRTTTPPARSGVCDPEHRPWISAAADYAAARAGRCLARGDGLCPLG